MGAETGGSEAAGMSETRLEGSMRAWAEALEAMEEESSDNFERKVILCFTQSINGLQRESQLYPRTILQDESRRVT